MNLGELLEWMASTGGPVSPATIRSLLDDRGVEAVATVRANAEAELARMRDSVDSDQSVTADAIRAVRDVLAATADVAPPGFDDAIAVGGESAEDDGSEADTDDTTGDEPETDDEPEAEPAAAPAASDGGGAVTLDGTNQQPDGGQDVSVSGEVLAGVPAEVFKASAARMTMSSPAVAARFSSAAAAVEQYQAFAGGQELHTAGEVADHVNDQLDLLRKARGSSDPRGVSLVQYNARPGAMKFHRGRDMSRQQVSDLLDSAVADHQQRQQFANGWCAPSVQRYEFCPTPSPWGLFGDALPIITSDRGGVEYPVSPSIGSLWGQGVECRTEEEEIERSQADPPQLKACTHLDCPEWYDNRNRICHICVTSDILQNRAFPEYTDQMIRTFELMYEHWINWQMLQVAIEIADDQNGELRWDTAGFGILQALKEKIAFAIDSASARSLFNPWGTQWNLAVPFWMYGAIQADAAKRVGADMQMMTLMPSHIDTIISSGRTLRIFPLMPWQQALTEDVPDPAMRTWFGSDTSLQSGRYPDTMEMLLWQQGALVGVRDDFLDIRARWDYGMQRNNQQLEMFSESEWNVIPRCGEVMHITLDICTSGRSGALFEYPCGPVDGGQQAESAKLSKKESQMARALTQAILDAIKTA